MLYQIVGKGIKIKNWMRLLVSKATFKLDKYLTHFSHDAKFIRVVIGKHPSKHYKVRLQLKLPKKTLFAQETGEKLRTTLNSVIDEIRSQLRKYLDKLANFR